MRLERFLANSLQQSSNAFFESCTILMFYLATWIWRAHFDRIIHILQESEKRKGFFFLRKGNLVMSSFNQMLLQWLIVAMLVHSSPSILVIIRQNYVLSSENKRQCLLYFVYCLEPIKACAIVNY